MVFYGFLFYCADRSSDLPPRPTAKGVSTDHTSPLPLEPFIGEPDQLGTCLKPQKACWTNQGAVAERKT